MLTATHTKIERCWRWRPENTSAGRRSALFPSHPPLCDEATTGLVRAEDSMAVLGLRCRLRLPHDQIWNHSLLCDLLSARKADFYVDEHRDYLSILLAGVELPFSDRRNSRLIQVRVLRCDDSYVADGTILPTIASRRTT